LYFGWAALGTLRSGEVSLYMRANRDIRFSRKANPAGYWIAVLLVPRARRGLCLGHRHSRVVAMTSDEGAIRNEMRRPTAPEITNLGHYPLAPA